MNNCCFAGRLTSDPKLSSTMNGDVNVKFAIAVDRRHGRKQKDAAREANRPTADFIPCSAWKGAATTIATYCKKGDKITLTGSIRTNSYEKDGERRYGWVLEVREFEFDDHGRKAAEKNHQEAKGREEAPSDHPLEAPAEAPMETIPDEEVPF